MTSDAPPRGPGAPVAPPGTPVHPDPPESPRRPARPRVSEAPARPVPADVEDLFGHVPSPTTALPAPTPIIAGLTRNVVEILAGARDLDQVARWVSDDVYKMLLKRTVLSARARQARGERISRPAITLGPTHCSEPADGVVEAVTVVHGRGRSRSVAIRLEGIDRRWRATAIAVL